MLWRTNFLAIDWYAILGAMVIHKARDSSYETTFVVHVCNFTVENQNLI